MKPDSGFFPLTSRNFPPDHTIFSVILTYTHLSNESIALVSWTCLNSKWEFKWDLRKVDGLFFSSLSHALPIKGVLCFWKTNYAKCWGRGGDKGHRCVPPCSGHWDDRGVPYICHQTFKPHNNSKRENVMAETQRSFLTWTAIYWRKCKVEQISLPTILEL